MSVESHAAVVIQWSAGLDKSMFFGHRLSTRLGYTGVSKDTSLPGQSWLACLEMDDEHLAMGWQYS